VCPLYFSTSKNYTVIGNSNGRRFIEYANQYYNKNLSYNFTCNGAFLHKEKTSTNKQTKPALRDMVCQAFKERCENLVIICPWLLDACEAVVDGSEKELVAKTVEWYEELAKQGERHDKVIFIVHQLIDRSDTKDIKTQAYFNILTRNNKNLDKINHTLSTINAAIQWTRNHPRAIIHYYAGKEMDQQNGVHLNGDMLDSIYHILNNHTGYNCYDYK